ncbi:hypothetical protein HK414_16025 [Ramlibacter terrae]|uniref:Uncharacterized protein n=1 Tax=Ramlibacter terrae TaxID=2732511 RepID=A0ABX6P4K2_9BURK|nr:hypothetical protein HK414_16025 [Ramlibacter terrae]
MAITATGDANIHGSFELAGSMQVKAGDDISVLSTVLVKGEGQSLSLIAGDAIDIGSMTDDDLGAVLEASKRLELTAGGRVAIGASGQLLSSGDDSTIALRGASVTVLGSVFAGAELTDPEESDWTWEGKRASIDIRATGALLLGDIDDAGNLWATGRIAVQTGADASGVGFSMTRGSAIRADALGRLGAGPLLAAKWTEVQAGADASIDLRSEGDIRAGAPRRRSTPVPTSAWSRARRSGSTASCRRTTPSPSAAARTTAASACSST